MNPEQSRQEQFIGYAEALRERFAEGCLSELQNLNHCGNKVFLPFLVGIETTHASKYLP
jgi:hypothetical protein